LPRPARRADRGRAELLERLSGGDERAALAALLEAEDSLDVEDALFRSGSSDAGPHPQLGSMLVSSQRMAELSERTAAALRHHHAAHPLERGMGRELLRAELGLSSDSFDVLVSALPEVVEEGATVRLAGFSVSLDGEQRKAADQLIATIEKDGFTPPLRKDLAADEALLRSLEASKELVRVGDFYLSAHQAEHARTTVRAHIASEGPATIAAIRDLLGTSRKYAVPLSEWLDATGATRRQGDVRVLGPSA
jgi:selenocysteine-specific elongation factor